MRVWHDHAQQALDGEKDDIAGGNQNQSQLWGIGFRGFTGSSSEWGNDGRKGGWVERASDDVDGRGGSELQEASVKISGPLGDQLSSITRRIQLQREAERIQHRSVTH